MAPIYGTNFKTGFQVFLPIPTVNLSWSGWAGKNPSDSKLEAVSRGCRVCCLIQTESAKRVAKDFAARESAAMVSPFSKIDHERATREAGAEKRSAPD